MPPSLFSALGLSFRAVSRSPALVAGGMVVGLLGRALTLPAVATAWALLLEAAALALRAHPFDAAAPFEAMALTATSAPFVLVVGGLLAAGLATRALLRVAWLAGALPQLGGEMGGAPGPRFASGVAFGLARLLPVTALGLVADLAAAGFSVTLGLAAARVATAAAGQGPAPLLAAATALALVLALLVPLAVSAGVDAAEARAALRAESPGAAFAGATRRFLARPGTFVLAALAFGIAGTVFPGAVQGFSSLATGFAPNVSPVVLAGPSLMLAAVAALVTATIDLAWLGTVAALACAREPQVVATVRST